MLRARSHWRRPPQVAQSRLHRRAPPPRTSPSKRRFPVWRRDLRKRGAIRRHEQRENLRRDAEVDFHPSSLFTLPALFSGRSNPPPATSIAALIQNNGGTPNALAIAPKITGPMSFVRLSAAKRTPSASPERPSGERAYMIIKEIGCVTLSPKPNTNAMIESATAVVTKGTSTKL